jgi:hypothetical protein
MYKMKHQECKVWEEEVAINGAVHPGIIRFVSDLGKAIDNVAVELDKVLGVTGEIIQVLSKMKQ